MTETVVIKKNGWDEETRSATCGKCRKRLPVAPNLLTLYIVPRGKPVCRPCALTIEPEIEKLYSLYWAAYGFANDLNENALDDLKANAMAFQRDTVIGIRLIDGKPELAGLAEAQRKGFHVVRNDDGPSAA